MLTLPQQLQLSAKRLAMSSDGSSEKAARWLEISERLLRARDLEGCLRFAERAVAADPLIDGGAADQIIAVAEVLLASQRRVNNHVDWYSVLHLDPSSPADRERSAVLRQYHRLALLLHPKRNRLDGASFAAKLVSDAWAVLSDPSKKSLFDAELDMAAAAAATPPPPPSPHDVSMFWTLCPSCCHLHQYDRDYEAKNLRCPNCQRVFTATPLSADPPVVPGTDSYYCSWGFIPLGFGGPGLSAEWKPFFPIFPMRPPPSNQSEAVNGVASAPLASKKKAVAKKTVERSSRKRILTPEATGTRSSERLKAKERFSKD